MPNFWTDGHNECMTEMGGAVACAAVCHLTSQSSAGWETVQVCHVRLTRSASLNNAERLPALQSLAEPQRPGQRGRYQGNYTSPACPTAPATLWSSNMYMEELRCCRCGPHRPTSVYVEGGMGCRAPGRPWL